MLDELPKDQYGQVMNGMRAAWKLRKAEAGEEKPEQLARYLEHNFASAARSRREGWKEMFTVPRLQLPVSLTKCLATTNIIESPQGGVQKKTHNVTRWRDAEMVERRVASALRLTEQRFHRVDGKRDRWALAAVLGRACAATPAEKDCVA